MIHLPKNGIRQKDNCWDATPRLIDGIHARKATVAALELGRYSRSLACMQGYAIDGNQSQIHIAIHQPLRDDDRTTLLSNPHLTKIAQPILEVVAGVQDYKPQFKGIGSLILTTLKPHGGIGGHMDLDKPKEDVSVTCLQGVAAIEVVHPDGVDKDMFLLRPGDEYGLRCTDDETTSPWHEIKVVSHIPRVALMLVDPET